MRRCGNEHNAQVSRSNPHKKRHIALRILPRRRKEERVNYTEDYYTGLGGVYFRKVLSTIIRMGNLEDAPGLKLILDFGCGVGHLKRALPFAKVIGYDILPENTDIEDYRYLKPDVIVCNAVLEHLSEAQIRHTLGEFVRMNPNAMLLVALPTENLISKIGMVLTTHMTAHDDHELKLRAVNRVLSEFGSCLERKRVFTMMEVSRWSF